MMRFAPLAAFYGGAQGSTLRHAGCGEEPTALIALAFPVARLCPLHWEGRNDAVRAAHRILLEGHKALRHVASAAVASPVAR